MRKNLQVHDIKSNTIRDQAPSLSLLVMIISMFVLYFFLTNVSFAESVPVTLYTTNSNDPILGSKNSSVTIFEYGDYQCPYCGQFHRDSEIQLRSEYVDKGLVRMVYRDQPMLGDESIAAASAAKCAQEQGKFWAFHDELYDAKIKDYTNGGSENDGFFNRNLFLKIAGKQGLNMTQFSQCYDNDKYLSVVKSEAVTYSLAGVSTVPTLIINDYELRGAPSYDELKTIINNKLKGQ